MLTREGVERGNTVIITSILPTDIGGREVDLMSREINKEVSITVPREGGTFIDINHHYEKDGREPI